MHYSKKKSIIVIKIELFNYHKLPFFILLHFKTVLPFNNKLFIAIDPKAEEFNKRHC